MATLDTSIYAQFGAKPVSFVDSMREFAQIEDDKIARKGNKLALLINEQKYADMQRQRERGNALDALLRQGDPSETPQARSQRLRAGGFFQEADAMDAAELGRQKSVADADKTRAEAEKAQLQVLHSKIDRHTQMLGAISTPQEAVAWLQEGQGAGLIDPQKAAAFAQQVQAMTPQQFQQWKQGMMRGGMLLKDQVEQEWKAKGFEEQVRHNRATEDNTRRGQNLSYSATIRGQDMTDARARTESAERSKGGGNFTEGERNASGYALRMDEATKLLDKFENSGKGSYTTQAIGAIPLVGDALQRVAMSPEQQQYKQAADDWIRAKLRKESGAVIGEQEMQAEYRTYFPIPGDSPEVIRQKREARAVASQAMRNAAGRAAPSSQPSQPKVVDFGSLK